MEKPIEHMITTYHELNPNFVTELTKEPSALEFMRFVATNRPFVVRGAAKHWPAVQKWDAQYLRTVMGHESVNVAVTPSGKADAVVEQENGLLVLAQPHEVSQSFDEFLTYVQNDSAAMNGTIEASYDETKRNVRYAQTQNDNLRDEYQRLFADVPKDIAFARIALLAEPDAINFWLGNSSSVTALHKDNYENIYVQVRGLKHFVLLPPVETPCVNEQDVAQGRYRPARDCRDSDDALEIDVQNDSEHVPSPLWDPDLPEEKINKFSHLAKPLHVTLSEGDMLYLPAMWFHKVSQSVGREGYSLAVNYWYDINFDGGFWPLHQFVRDVTIVSQKELH